MRLGRVIEICIACVACVAIVAGMLMPAAAHALGSGDAGWTEICSVSGPKRVRVGAGPDSAPAQAPLHLLEHCPGCAVHLPSLGLPPADAAATIAVAGASEVPALFLEAPRPLFAWRGPQPRAPPRA